MGKRQSIPRWRIVLPVLMIMLAVISMLFVSIPMAIPMRLSVLAGMMAFGSALFAGLGVAVLVHRRYMGMFMGMLSMAAGVALIGKWLWQMGQAWNLPRLERRSLDMTTLPVFGMLCLLVGIVGIVLASAHTLERERLRKAALQAA